MEKSLVADAIPRSSRQIEIHLKIQYEVSRTFVRQTPDNGILDALRYFRILIMSVPELRRVLCKRFTFWPQYCVVRSGGVFEIEKGGSSCQFSYCEAKSSNFQLKRGLRTGGQVFRFMAECATVYQIR